MTRSRSIPYVSILALALASVTLFVARATADPLQRTFTYQGRLMDAGQPANGTYDLYFNLYEDPVQNNGVGVGDSHNDVVVTNGLFTVQLNFGNDPGVFNGQRRWLDIGVRPGNSSGAYTRLSPRQELTATPNASYAIAAGSLTLPQAI